MNYEFKETEMNFFRLVEGMECHCTTCKFNGLESIGPNDRITRVFETIGVFKQ